MSMNHASVHPAEDAPTGGGGIAPREWMKDIEGMPATIGGLVLRSCQLIAAAISLSIMATTSDFSSVTAFCYLVAASGLQGIWSTFMALIDIYALLVKRSLQNQRMVMLFTFGDGITSNLTFAAVCASAGITVFIDNDLGRCSINHCYQFQSATALAFICWFFALPSYLLNLWSLASQ
ncbi:hypothetical protein SAY87_028670 [Trapa incisa]|uniref:CASP-like protein n=1 Tax=Trapa incisa TaxID=236973 RepID=A0AAN7KV53_9MYRT|nr:hypothetical protein SAY87_028670 [Trapa incisa]